VRFTRFDIHLNCLKCRRDLRQIILNFAPAQLWVSRTHEIIDDTDRGIPDILRAIS
jgi:hypothetical protein